MQEFDVGTLDIGCRFNKFLFYMQMRPPDV